MKAYLDIIVSLLFRTFIFATCFDCTFVGKIFDGGFIMALPV